MGSGCRNPPNSTGNPGRLPRQLKVKVPQQVAKTTLARQLAPARPRPPVEHLSEDCRQRLRNRGIYRIEQSEQVSHADSQGPHHYESADYRRDRSQAREPGGAVAWRGVIPAPVESQHLRLPGRLAADRGRGELDGDLGGPLAVAGFELTVEH